MADAEKRRRYFGDMAKSHEANRRIRYTVTRWDGIHIGIYYESAEVDQYYRDYNIYTVKKEFGKF